MEYWPFGGVLTPLLGFIKELKFQEKIRFSVKCMVKSLVEIFFYYYKIGCQNARNGISDLLEFEIFSRGGGGARRGSWLWQSLLPPPTFIFKPSTPKLIENPGRLQRTSNSCFR